MLGRELCVKLAEAYPEEIKDRYLEDDDLAYDANGGHPHLHTNFLDTSENLVWCPRLEDLLGIAQKVCPPDRWLDLCWEPGEYGKTQDAYHPGKWMCHAANDEMVTSRLEDAIGKGFSADTPEEAVAIWLLRVAEKEKRGENRLNNRDLMSVMSEGIVTANSAIIAHWIKEGTINQHRAEAIHMMLMSAMATMSEEAASDWLDTNPSKKEIMRRLLEAPTVDRDGS